MKVILKGNITAKYKIKDFAINPLNKDIITVGEKLSFYDKDLKELKTLSKKKDASDIIRYVKEKNQLFTSSTFYMLNSSNEMFKCDSSKKKVLGKLFKSDSININSIDISEQGKIVYTYGNKLYCNDIQNNSVIDVEIGEEYNSNHSIYIYGENIILKTRKHEEEANVIRLYDLQTLDEIYNLKTENNSTFVKLNGICMYLAKQDGTVEIWDTSYNEIEDIKKISNSKITYIEEDDEWLYIGNSSGELIITDFKFDVILVEKIFKTEIKKIVYNDDKLYILSDNGELLRFLLVDDDDETVIRKFIEKNNIHKDYHDFFDVEMVTEIENFINKLNINNTSYAPQQHLIFKALQTPLSTKKVCILGKDPYHQSNVATGLAFEVRKKSWSDKEINTSLKNILKLLYYSYTGKRAEIDVIRQEIDNGKFKILSPDRLFKSWELQGVLLLNTAFTVLLGKSGSHHKFWNVISQKLLRYISTKNSDIVYLLWGKDALQFDKYILSDKKIVHNHPAICGQLDVEKDFLNGKSFIETKEIINWLGEM